MEAATTTVPDWPFPWAKPKGMYDSDGPLTPIVASIEGVNFRVAPVVGRDGLHTGRTRYLVICCDCQELLHEATTGPSSRIKHHLSETHKQRKENT